MKIPFNIPHINEKAEMYIKESLESLKHCGNNDFANRVVKLMQTNYNFKDIFLTSSCTTALEMGALLADLKVGDEVILPSYTFSSTANAVVLRGAKPVFCEISQETMNIDANKIEGLITDKTKMIVPIDYAGIPCEINKIMELATKYNLIVLQDTAQSFHSFHKDGAACGSKSTLSAFSFHETKNINCGEGGALIVNDENLVERAHFLQEKGTDRSLVLKGVKSKYSWVDLGSSFLLSDILAAMLLSQIEDVNNIVSKRGLVTSAYKNLFAPYVEQSLLNIPIIPDGAIINNHAFFVIFDNSRNQELFLSSLREKNIFAYIGYMPLHSSPMGKKFGYKDSDLPITEDIASRLVRLPLYNALEGKYLDYCINGMKDVLKSIYNN
jgi:dTDP-4-amino-4,6-dideoxygalactose transaminase